MDGVPHMVTPRAIWVPIAVAFATLAFAVAAAAQPSAALVSAVTISGHGFGHGIGLSQWGAMERAAAGQDHEQILGFYYPGAHIGTAPSRDVRVLLAEQPQLTIGAGSSFTVRDASGRAFRLAAGRYPVSAHGLLAGRHLLLPVTVEPGETPVMLGATRYHGTLTLELHGTDMQAVNTVDLEDYVADVVSYENPAYWPQEALRSQAIASRSYVLANLRPAAAFDVYPDDRSQNYAGLRKEYPTAVAAAAATRGEVLRYGGRVADAFFSASNGGLTSGNEDAWGGPQLPYLTTRVDPFDARSPKHDWGPVRIDLSRLHRAFPELPSALVAISLTRNASERAKSITFQGVDGSTFDVSGPAFQERLGLSSTYFSLSPAY